MPRVDNQGISIHYRVEGDGPPLVLQHGFSDSSETWYERGFVAALKPNYSVVLIDVRGHGQSDKPHDPPFYAPEKFASDIVAVLDDLGMKTATYWGYSMGGWIGFAMARYALDRVACCVFRARRRIGRYRIGISDRTWKGRHSDCSSSWRTRRDHQSLGRVGDPPSARACLGQ